MKLRRILSICLVLILLVTSAGMLSGCNDKPKAVDLGGRVVKMISWGTSNGGVYVDPNDTSDFGILKQERLAEYEKAYNCKFEFELMEVSEIPSKLTTAALAGDSIGDFVCMRHPSIRSLVENELLLPVNEYFDLSLPQFSDFATKHSTINGKVYGFSTETTNHVENALMFNKKIFDELGVEYPYEHVKNKTWTTDVFADYLKRLTVVKDGKTEIYGMYGFYHNNDNLAHFLAAFGAEFVKETENGYVSGLNDPEMTTALDFIRENTLAGYIYNTSGEAPYTEAGEFFNEGKVAMAMGQISAAAISDGDENIGWAPLPLGPDQTEYAASEMYENVWTMPASLDPTVAQALADIITGIWEPTYENEEEQREQLKETIAGRYGDEESLDIAVDLLLTDNMNVFNHFSIGVSDFRTIVGGQINSAIHGNKVTVAAALGAVSAPWEMLIEMYNEEHFSTDDSAETAQ